MAEGPQAVREAFAVAGVVLEVFADAEATGRYPELRTRADATGVPWQIAGADVVAVMSQTVRPQGVVARCRFLDVPLEALVARLPRLVAVCADMRDPGNAGSVLRCADAAGAEGVVLVGDSVDPYNPKAVRASAGSLFHIDVVVEPDPARAVDLLRSRGLRVIAADGRAEIDLDAAADGSLLVEPTAWLFGNEAWGLPDAVRDLAEVSVRVPIYGRAESLNLATAAAVCLYASARAQRAALAP